MTEFVKMKITFSLALLAALFALNPILEAVGSMGYDFLGVKIEIRFAYYLLASLLGLTVYLFGVEFITERHMGSVKKIANISYGLAILVIPLYFAFFLVVKITQLIGPVMRSPLAPLILDIVFAVVGVFWVSRIANVLAKKLAKKDIESEVDELSNQETVLLSRGTDLYKNGHYDLTVVESFKVIELSIRKKLISEAIPFRPTIADMLLKTEKHALISQEIRGQIDEIRMVRNKTAHTFESVSKNTAKQALSIARKVLFFLDGDEAYDRAKIDKIQVETWIGTDDKPIRGSVPAGKRTYYIRESNVGNRPYLVTMYPRIIGDNIKFESGETSTETQGTLLPTHARVIRYPIIINNLHKPRMTKIELKVVISETDGQMSPFIRPVENVLRETILSFVV